MAKNGLNSNLKWRVLYAVMTGGFLIAVDGSIVNLALPTLVKEFGIDFSMIQWVIICSLLAVATLILIMGRLGDIFGKKKVYLSGFILFTIGSALCGLATSVYWLIGFRVLQGIGRAMILALNFAIATEAFPKAERGKAMGILASVVCMGVIVGPVIGGFLIDFLSWHWIFFVNLPVGLLGIYLVVKYVPDSRSQDKPKFDFMGAIIFFACMFSLFMGLTLKQRSDFVNTEVSVLLVFSFMCLLLFIFVEKRQKSPMIDFGIFKNICFNVNLSLTFIFNFAISGIFILAPFYLQNILGYMPSQMGLLFGVMSVTMVLFSPLAGILSDRLGTSTVIIFSLMIMMLVYFSLVIGIGKDTTTMECIAAMAFFGIAMGFFMSPNHSAIMGAIPKNYFGIGSALLILARTLGQAAGVSTLGTIWTGRSELHNGASSHAGITTASVNTGIEGFQNISLFAAMITLFSLLLVVWWAAHERRVKSIQPSNIAAAES